MLYIRAKYVYFAFLILDTDTFRVSMVTSAGWVMAKGWFTVLPVI
jgi:hypothetical protein